MRREAVALLLEFRRTGDRSLVPQIREAAQRDLMQFRPRQSSTPLPKPIMGPRKEKPLCSFLGEPTGETVEQYAKGCPGAKETSVFACLHEKHEYAAPFARCSGLARADVTACEFCLENTTK